MTLTKEVKGLYDKNLKSLKKEIKEDLRRWKESPLSWNVSINGHLAKRNLQIHLGFESWGVWVEQTDSYNLSLDCHTHVRAHAHTHTKANK